MNPRLDLLHPYPFEKLAQLFSGIVPAFSPINLGIGEPQHAAPSCILDAYKQNIATLAQYPATIGTFSLRQSIANWLMRRYGPITIDPATQVLPANGSREALFAIAQVAVNPEDSQALVLCPNPFYQIYEGAAYLSGAKPYFLNTTPENDFFPEYTQVPPEIWARTRLLFVCSPNNPTGVVLNVATWRELFALSDTYGFIIAADECYSEIYCRSSPPLGALEAAHALGRFDYRGLLVFSSLSKRSNVPGLRSGFIAGDADLLAKFLRYRTYHGSAMPPPTQAASIAAWSDEVHVAENRAQYALKFAQLLPKLQNCCTLRAPEAGFYLWAGLPVSDTEFARRLYEKYHVTVLPGSYIAREVNGRNPGKNYIRMALVPPLATCIEAGERIVQCLHDLSR